MTTLRFADSHNDLLMSVLHQQQSGVDTTWGSWWVDQLVAGGVDLQVLPICMTDAFAQEAALRRTLLMVDAAYRLADTHRDRVAIVTSAEEIREARRKGLIGLVLAMEGAEAIGRDPGMLRVLHRLGIRMIALTWNRRTAFADGAGEPEPGGGLTVLGREVLAEMEELGVIADVSHLSQGGFLGLAEHATRPFIASHSSAMALHEHRRNLTDEQLRIIAAKDSFVGVNAYGVFLAEAGRRTMETYVDHIAHIAGIIGDARTGLGADFILDVFCDTEPTGSFGDDSEHLVAFRRPEDFPALGEVLIRRFGAHVAEGIAGANLTRFLERSLS
ncbi:thermostable dipeptidase [Microbacterium paludicola]|uniref:Thermostable dipeptidase n=1 Tax=Microbacterium paludicola TaxID=300019 RepID=A0A4Y9FSQ3_9MICO|nr:membrane dipeptidase [Microbacterium paludicola]MBF0817291.1 membrane dipeptidase [Microbacterium paludicola]TFU31996.1 thermostable dipeptidase [Microbacterium paludicola]